MWDTLDDRRGAARARIELLRMDPKVPTSVWRIVRNESAMVQEITIRLLKERTASDGRGLVGRRADPTPQFIQGLLREAKAQVPAEDPDW